MASKNTATTRVLTCAISGVKFEWARGYGRPPKYAPGVKPPRKPRAKKVAAVAA